jgi:hypothetical protein
MFFGIIILIVIITFGIYTSGSIPNGMTKDVWIYSDNQSLGDVSVCRGSLHPGGLRGSILGWTDGMLQGWKTVYLGG